MSTHPLTRLATSDQALLGVARALAARFEVDPLAVRLAFVTLTVAGGWGIVLYLALWALWLPDADPAAARPSVASGRAAVVRTLGVALAMVGVLLILRGRAPGFADGLVWPVALVSSGLMLAWHQLIPPEQLDGPDRPEGRVPALGSTVMRVGGGAVLLVAGLGFLLAANLSIDAARDAIVASAVAVAGLLLLFGPWVMRLTRTATEERSRRIRADERAEVAAHLHDSVLQTLTLMQKQATDPAAMATLARQQERELRRWLYNPQAEEGAADGFVEELEVMVAEVEDQHRIRVDAVTVGNMAMEPRLRAVVGAAREALVNAAKFSGERQVALYAQVDQEAVEVFVRDRGRGFDPAAVPADRRGIADSIEGRMHRAGGTATLKTAPGDGTEVHVRLPRVSRGDLPRTER